ncbi:MAG: hypothetical protein J4473_05745 [Candidatus Aenigmarchaeota archaeon]|nr:hypothetical protein [Candidatus Aenigmarchaeota archaeon]
MNRFMKYLLIGAGTAVISYAGLKPEYESTKRNDENTADIGYHRRGHGPTPPTNWRELRNEREKYILRRQLEKDNNDHFYHPELTQ